MILNEKKLGINLLKVDFIISCIFIMTMQKIYMILLLPVLELLL